MGKQKRITYDMRKEYVEKTFNEHFRHTLNHPEFKAIYDFGTDRDRKLLDLAYTIAKSEFLWGYLSAQHMDEELKKELKKEPTPTTDQVQE